MTASWLPPSGEVFLDKRGSHRTLRLSWHQERGLVVLSLWRGGVCTGTFRLAVEEVPEVIEALSRGLTATYDEVTESPSTEPAAG